MARKPTPDDHRKRPLEPPENSDVRDHLDEWRFRKWLGEKVRGYAVWITSVSAAVIVFRQWITDAFRWLLTGGGP